MVPGMAGAATVPKASRVIPSNGQPGLTTATLGVLETVKPHNCGSQTGPASQATRGLLKMQLAGPHPQRGSVGLGWARECLSSSQETLTQLDQDLTLRTAVLQESLLSPAWRSKTREGCPFKALCQCPEHPERWGSAMARRILNGGTGVPPGGISGHRNPLWSRRLWGQREGSSSAAPLPSWQF